MTTATRKPWTDEEVQYITTSDASYAIKAEKLGRTAQSVRRKMQKLAVTPEPETVSEDSGEVSLEWTLAYYVGRDKNIDVSYLARVFNVSVHHVKKMRHLVATSPRLPYMLITFRTQGVI